MTDDLEFSAFAEASVEVTWRVLTDRTAMLGWMGLPELELEIETTWEPGTPMIIRGVHHAPFENRGTVERFEAPHRLRYTHLSSLSHLPERPESHTALDFTLTSARGGTELRLVLANFPTESIRHHLAFYWRGTLPLIARAAEQAQAAAR